MSAKGRDEKFLNCFWELASSDAAARVKAGETLLQHLQKQLAANGSPEVSDLQYSVTRLLKGLASSRECARQGFAAALAEVLVQFPQIETAQILDTIDKETKITGSLKGHEERDMIFAKLFCYLALIRSNRVHGTYTSGGNSTYNSINGSTNSSSTYLVVELLSRLLTLYNMKGWLQEIVTEAILLLLDRLYIHNNSSNSSKSEDVDEEIVQLLSPIVSAPLEDFSASQVMFAIGLQHIVSASAKHANRNSCNEISYKKVKKQKKNSVNSSNSSINGSADHSADSSTNSSTAHCLLRLVPQEKHVQIEYLSRIESTLLAATAGFPKIHQVWYYVISLVLGMNSERQLLSWRENAVLWNDEKEEQLTTITEFINTKLIEERNSSKEKRSVGYALVSILLQHSPVNMIPVIVSKAVVRSLYSSRANKRNTLYSLAYDAITNIKLAADNDPSRSLAIASVFVLHGGPNFDGNTGTDVVQTLVQSLDSSSLVAYAKLLFGMLNEVSRSTASTDSVQSNRMEGEQDNSTVEVNEEVVNSSADTAVGILNAILSAAKNTRLSGHKQLLPIVAILLVRIVCFDNNFVVGKQKQFVKSLKKECGDSSYAELETLSKYLKNGRDVLFVDNSDEDNSNTIYSDEVKTIAASSLLGLLAQFPTLSLDYSSNNEKSTDDNHKYITILDVVIAAIRFFGVNSANSFVAASSDRFSDDSTDNSESPKDIIDAATKLYFLLSLNPGAGVDNNSDEKKFYKFQQCFASFLGQAMCYILSTQDLSMKVIQDTINVWKTINSIKNGKDETNEESSADGSEKTMDALQLLFDTSLEFLSLSSDQSIKSIREGNKRLWHATISFIFDRTAVKNVQESSEKYLKLRRELRSSVGDLLDSVVTCVIGEQSEVSAEEDEDELENEDSDDDAFDNRDVKEQKTVKKINAVKSAKRDDSTSNGDGDSDSDRDGDSDSDGDNDSDKNGNGDDEDIEISQEDAMLLLSGEFVGNEDEETELLLGGGAEGIAHSSEHDQALAQFIALKKQGRKEGLVQALRRQLLVRTRAMDILEVLIDKIEAQASPVLDLDDDTRLLLLSLYAPLLKCLNKITKSSLFQTASEGKSFTTRLSAILEQKLFAKKIQFIAIDCDDEAEEYNKEVEKALVEDVKELLLSLLPKLLTANDKLIRDTAKKCMISVCKIISSYKGENSAELQRQLQCCSEELLSKYFTKKNGHITTTFIEDLYIQRFPTLLLPALIAGVSTALASEKQNKEQRKISAFMQRELCTLVGSIYKHLKSYENSLKATLLDTLPQFLLSFSTIIKTVADTITNDSNSEEVARKKDQVMKSVTVIISCVSGVIFDTMKNNIVTGKNLKKNLQLFIQQLQRVVDLVESENSNKTMSKNVNKQVSSVTQLITKINSLSLPDKDSTKAKESKTVVKNEHEIGKDKKISKKRAAELPTETFGVGEKKAKKDSSEKIKKHKVKI